MDYKYGIFGIKFNNAPCNVEEKFEERYFDESERAEYLSKEEFFHDDETSFYYKYMIDVNIYEGKTYYSLNMVIAPKSLGKKHLESVLSCCGIDENDVDYTDVFDYGCYIMLADECTDCEKIDMEILNEIAEVSTTIDRLRGFYLDKQVNRIGNIGWDLIADYVKDEPCFDKVLARYKEMEKDK